ncbi:TniQ family protein [Variovorax sp. RB2P76]|uniref:TniQ family protein n=1 Tax=Variovorax sp. RB2P76 TaxID=3443736 RepID=UPI003F46DC2C
MSAGRDFPRLSFIPSWALGETLYSWCGKTHRTFSTSAHQTGITLFGSQHADKSRLMPRNLGHFARTTDGAMGSSSYVLQRRTAVGAYAAFCDPRLRQQLFQDLEGSAPGASFYSVGMTGRVRMNRLRYCTACAHADLRGGTPPRWLVAHQLPAVFTCLHHNAMLTCVESHPDDGWQLPLDSRKEEPLAGKNAHLAVLRLLAKLSQSVVSHQAVDVDALCNRALATLVQRKIVLEGESLEASRLHAHLQRSALHRWLRLAFPMATVTTHGHWMVELLTRRPRSLAASYLMLWAFVFDEHGQQEALGSFAQAAFGTPGKPQHLQRGLFDRSPVDPIARSGDIASMQISTSPDKDLVR